MTTTSRQDAPPAPAQPPTEGMRIDAVGLRRVVRGRRRREAVLLHDVSLSIRPGELVAIVGGSGAGKTTLLNTLAGVQPPSAGSVRYNGRDLYANLDGFRTALGYVPQDDIVHRELSVRRTLEYAAELRLPPETAAAKRRAAVVEALDQLGLSSQAEQTVGSLSGGQRKRSSIGVELLTRPRVFFLDEPTSGLDPATDREMMRQLRRLTDDGSTVVLTTHAPHDIGLCDRVIFLARGGYVTFDGTPPAALAYFAAADFDEIYERVGPASPVAPEEWARRFRGTQAEAGGIEPGEQNTAPVAAAASARPPQA